MSRFTMLIVLSFLLGVPAFAQFEINPDHPDADGQKLPAQQAKAKAKIRLAGKAATSAAAARANRGKQGQATGTSSQQPGAPSLESANAGAGKTANSGGSANSTKRRLKKTRALSSLQTARENVAESPAPK
jgi:hypothetical protein